MSFVSSEFFETPDVVRTLSQIIFVFDDGTRAIIRDLTKKEIRMVIDDRGEDYPVKGAMDFEGQMDAWMMNHVFVGSDFMERPHRKDVPVTALGTEGDKQDERP